VQTKISDFFTFSQILRLGWPSPGLKDQVLSPNGCVGQALAGQNQAA
jgi:hypothetical protein